jgi:hypothetical protein
LIFDAHPFPARRLARVGAHGSFGPAATLAHMVERCRFCLNPRLFSAGEEELQV